MSYTITEECVLPSKGLIYSKSVNPYLKLRSMTTEEEMRRLSPTKRPYKTLCDIIDECIVGDKPGISSYDMCIADYLYLLQKLRIATYGPDYKIGLVCPHCNAEIDETINLAEMELIELAEDETPELTVSLPVTGKLIRTKLLTPRSLDDNAIRREELLNSNHKLETDPALLFTLTSIIDTIDGVVYDKLKLDQFVRLLPMRDTNKILNCVKKLNRCIGYNMLLNHKCEVCGLDYTSTFRITSEYFGPEED